MKMPVIVLAVVVMVAPTRAQEMVPFVIPWATNGASAIARSFDPIPVDGERVVVRDGHFALGANPVRVWGVNTCFGANFPTREEAATTAARLAAAGVNSVRLHHMDTSAYPRGIRDPADALKLSTQAVERLDFFIDQLARHGINVNVNLHVGRVASKALGLPETGTGYDKIVGLFTPELIEAQKQYARDLLGRTNVFRKVRYADDPAVAFVEITNEDSFFMWDGEQRLRALPAFYAQILRRQYAAWLKIRYGNTDALRRAWAEGVHPLGTNQIAGSIFPKAEDRDTVGWRLEQHGESAARMLPPGSGSGPVRVAIAADDGTSWHLQFKQTPLAVTSGKLHTVSFRARADSPRRITYSVMQDHDPWESLGLNGAAELTPEWRAFRASFVARSDDKLARLSFGLGGSAVSVELADVFFGPGGGLGLDGAESIEAASIAVFGADETESRMLDRVRFLADAEKRYFDGMRRFLKEELGVKALVTGTIVFGPCGLYAQSDMDFVDGHAYWQHPHFRGKPWDPVNWVVEQKAMADDPEGSTLRRLAAERLKGKPFTVSEYNHPAPNDSQAECVPLIAAFGAAQDWDGVWLFAYGHRTRSTETGFDSFFDIDMNPSKFGFMRAGAAIFRDKAIQPLDARRVINLAEDADALTAVARLHLHGGASMLAAAGPGLTIKALLREQLMATLRGRSDVVASGSAAAPLSWMTNGRSCFLAVGRGAVVRVGRMGDGREAESDGITLTQPGFAAVIVSALDGKAMNESDTILVTACGRCENTDMKFSADRRTVGRDWGRGPVRIEPVAGAFALPAGEWTCHALRPDGTPAEAVPVLSDAQGRRAVQLSPARQTMWYLVTRSQRP